MIGSDALAILYGLASAASWGTGDFIGGVATRRNSVFRVIILSQCVGGVVLFAVALALPEPMPSLNTLFLGCIAGVVGTLGLVALYSGLAGGQMGLVAPVSVVVAAILPVTVSIANEGLPSTGQTAGFVAALTAAWFLSGGGANGSLRLCDLKLPAAAGLGFGLFFIIIDHVSDEAVLWPSIASRFASTLLLILLARTRRERKLRLEKQWHIIALAGIFDAGGNAFFALATRAGRLDISAVLASLYPAATVLLARFLLKERLGRQQWIGVVTALIALVWIAQ